MAATLDIVSGGRLELGIGAGWNQEECDAYGIELPPLKERFDQFDEALEAIVGLLSNETTDLDGTYYQLTEARCEPKPVQRPHPPICIGGSGPKRTLRAVARLAQHWNHPGGSVEDWRKSYDVLLGHCAAIGRDPTEIIDVDPSAARRRRRRRRAGRAGRGVRGRRHGPRHRLRARRPTTRPRSNPSPSPWNRCAPDPPPWAKLASEGAGCASNRADFAAGSPRSGLEGHEGVGQRSARARRSQSAGSSIGIDDELRRADLAERLDPFARARHADRDDELPRSRSGRRSGQQRTGPTSGTPRVAVGDQRAEVLGVDLAVVLGRGRVDDRPAARATSSAVQNDGSQPSPSRPDPAQLGRGDAAEPHVDRLLHRLGPHGHALEWKRSPSWSTSSSVQSRRMQRIASLNTGALAPCGRRRRPGARPGSARRGRTPGSSRPPDSRSRRGQLLGQHHRVAARDDEHARAELELGRAAGGVGQGDERVGRLAGDPFADSHSESKPQPLERVDERAEAVAVVGQRAGAKPEPDADLHRCIMPCRSAQRTKRRCSLSPRLRPAGGAGTSAPGWSPRGRVPGGRTRPPRPADRAGAGGSHRVAWKSRKPIRSSVGRSSMTDSAASGPSTIITATARFSSTTGPGAMSREHVVEGEDPRQSVCSAVGASLCTAAIAAWS